jgi:integrase
MRQPRPWFRKQTKTWYVQIDGEQINLGRNEHEAWENYYDHMARRGRAEPTPEDTVAKLLNIYLCWCKANRAPATFEKNALHLKRFLGFIGAEFQVKRLKPLHVQQWIDQQYVRTSDTYKNIAISAVKAALNWSVEQGYLEHSPISSLRKPKVGVREFFVPAPKWLDVLDAARGEEFRDYLTVTLASGARPQEMRRVESRHYEPQFSRWVFRVTESKGKTRQRAVYLDDTATKIVEKLVERYPEGPLFRNSRGKPWTKGAITARFRRLKAKLNMPELCAYTLRHSYSHWKLTTGTEAHIVSKLLGHKDGRMLETRYGHAEQNEAFMLQQATKTESPLHRTAGHERPG